MYEFDIWSESGRGTKVQDPVESGSQQQHHVSVLQSPASININIILTSGSQQQHHVRILHSPASWNIYIILTLDIVQKFLNYWGLMDYDYLL